jgi:hypothetical protein
MLRTSGSMRSVMSTIVATRASSISCRKKKKKEIQAETNKKLNFVGVMKQ